MKEITKQGEERVSCFYCLNYCVVNYSYTSELLTTSMPSLLASCYASSYPNHLVFFLFFSVGKVTEAYILASQTEFLSYLYSQVGYFSQGFLPIIFLTPTGREMQTDTIIFLAV